jgi:hypothetical protein
MDETYESYAGIASMTREEYLRSRIREQAAEAGMEPRAWVEGLGPQLRAALAASAANMHRAATERVARGPMTGAEKGASYRKGAAEYARDYRGRDHADYNPDPYDD